MMAPLSAWQSRAADSMSVSSTVCRSKVDRLMTLSTSAVAVCCCSDLRSSLRRGGVSIAVNASAGKILDQRNLLICEGVDFLAVDVDDTHQSALLKHRHANDGPIAPEFDTRNHVRIAFDIRLQLSDISNVDHLFAGRNARQNAIRWR